MDIVFDRISALIIRARENGRTDAEMERIIGLPAHSINKWFTGKYKSYKNYLPQIAAFFGVSIAYLLGETDIPQNDSKDDFSDIRMIGRASQKMRPEDREHLLKYMRFMFPDAFDD